MTHLSVHGLGVLVPTTSLVTVTPVPDGVKLTLPGPSVTLVFDAVTFEDDTASTTTLSKVTLFKCDESYPSRVTFGVFEPPATT